MRSLKGSVQSLLIYKGLWAIICRMVARWSLEIGLFFGGGAFYFLVHRGASFTDFMLGVVLSIITIYLWTESYRWNYWKDVYYNESNRAASRPPPKNLIKLLVRRIRRGV